MASKCLTHPAYDGSHMYVMFCESCDVIRKEFIAGKQTQKRTRHPNSERFHAILREHAELHDKKQADYGRGDDPFANIRASDEWGIKPWVGAMVRLNDKVRRLQGFALRGSLANESVEDSLRDIAVYATIALVLYEQEGKATRKTAATQRWRGLGDLRGLPQRVVQTTASVPSPDSSNISPLPSDQEDFLQGHEEPGLELPPTEDQI